MDTIQAGMNQTVERSANVAKVFERRMRIAHDRFQERVGKAAKTLPITSPAALANPWSVMNDWTRYAVDSRSARSCSGTRCASAATTSSSTTRAGLPPVLHFDYEMVLDGAHVRAAGQLRAGAHRAARGREGRSDEPALRHHRSARRPRPGHRRLQGRFAGRRRAARRPPGLLRHLLPRARAGPDAARRLRRRAGSSCARCASCIPKRPKPAIVGNCQGGWAAMMLAAAEPGRHRPDRHQRRADVVLGRRLERGRGRQPDALRRRPARRHLARVAHLRPRRRQVRRRLAGAELREPEPGQHASGTSTTTCSRTSTPSRRASSSSSAGGAAST